MGLEDCPMNERRRAARKASTMCVSERRPEGRRTRARIHIVGDV